MRKLNIWNLQVSFAKFCIGYKLSFHIWPFSLEGFPLNCFYTLVEGFLVNSAAWVASMLKKRSLLACWIKNQTVRIKELPAKLGDHLQMWRRMKRTIYCYMVSILLERQFPNPRIFPGMSVWAMGRRIGGGGSWESEQQPRGPSGWAPEVRVKMDESSTNHSFSVKDTWNSTWHL